jgi:hypothetical protein
LGDAFSCEIPAERVEQAKQQAAIQGDEVYKVSPNVLKFTISSLGLMISHSLSFFLSIFSSIIQEFPRHGDLQPANADLVEALLNRSWRAALTVTGADGFPPIKTAGNVLRPSTTLKLSLRVPPRVNAKEAAVALKQLLDADAPYGAGVKVCQENMLDKGS